ncbi:hypothetical protein IOD14_21575 [Streptomyces sp. A2-16]|uniref:hypothetical protein n=1 Tax=Streptomyces sp. A2-16 TaxID=2781734 RepID=UPI001BB02E4E|nr:hypothetical protein [Streptomyces sp. A2-16]QUC59154.1 hypothetical protein IOD14_21575 [Streptomyces sp. A2-16]
MARKPFTLRQAVLIGTALAAGSAAGQLAEAMPGEPHGFGHLAATATALWVLDKLHRLIDDRES